MSKQIAKSRLNKSNGGLNTMRIYEYGRINTLSQSLENSDIGQDIADQIMEGGETIRRGTRPEKKAEWMKGAMHRTK